MDKDKLDELQAYIEIGLLISQFGLGAAIKLIQGLTIDDVTLDDLKALRERLRIDEPFFEDKS